MQITLLQKKRELFSRVYDITAAAVFTGGESDAQTYIDLMEARGGLFDQIKILDDEISDIMPGTEAESIMADIRKTAGDILALDKKIGVEASRIMDGIKKSLKGINEGRNASIKYTDFITTSDGLYFDKKN